MKKILKRIWGFVIGKYNKIKNSFLYGRKNPYFLDKPISKKKDDLIGFDAQVDALLSNIKEGAKMVGVVTDYGSGKSSLVNLLKKRFKFRKVVKINLWNVENNNLKDLHSQFLFQLTAGLHKRKTVYLTKKLNPNYNNASISVNKRISYYFLFFALLFFVISLFNANGILDYINVFKLFGLNNLSSVFEILANLSSFLWIGLIIISILMGDIVFSYSKGGKNKRIINKSELIETYLSIVKKFGRRIVIVIEDLDRLNNKTVKKFLKEIYTYYVHSNSKKVTFVVAFKPEDYLDNMEEHYKVFDFTVDIRSLKSSDLWEVFKSLLRTKEDIVKYKFGIDFSGNKIDKWMWLTRGKNLNLRQVKQRYNDALLQYVTLKTRFSDKSGIRLESCIAFSYLKNEYPVFYGILIKTDGYAKPILRVLVDQFLKSNRELVAKDEFWGSLAKEEYGFTYRFMQDVYDLIRNGYISDNFEIYAYNYPKLNHVFTQSEDMFYRAFLYGEDIQDVDAVISDVLQNPDFIKETLKRVDDLGLIYPDIIFDNEFLFDYIYSSFNLDLKEKLIMDKLSISQHSTVKTLKILKKISQYKIVDSEFLIQYFTVIRDKFREDYDDYGICRVRKSLLEIFNNNKADFEILYDEDFPAPSRDECETIENFNLVLRYFTCSKKNSISLLSSYLLHNYDHSYFNQLLDYLYTLDLKLLIQLLGSVGEDLFSKGLNGYKKKLLDLFYSKGAFNSADSLLCTKLFLNKIKYLNSFLGTMLLYHLDGFLDKEEFCDIINKFKELPSNLLNYVTSVSFNYDYPFSPSLQNFFYKRKKYLVYLRAKVSYEGKLVFEENKISELRNTYFSLLEDIELFNEFKKHLFNNRRFINFYKENRIYEKCNDDRILLFSKVTQDYDLLEYVFKNIKNSLELDEYILNTKNIKLLMLEWESLIKNYSFKMSALSSEAKEHMKKYMPTTSKRRFAEFCENGKGIFK